jgi:hypothetical protein
MPTTADELWEQVKAAWPLSGNGAKPSRNQVHAAAYSRSMRLAIAYDTAAAWVLRRVQSYAICKWVETTEACYRPNWKAWAEQHSGLADKMPDHWQNANPKPKARAPRSATPIDIESERSVG